MTDWLPKYGLYLNYVNLNGKTFNWRSKKVSGMLVIYTFELVNKCMKINILKRITFLFRSYNSLQSFKYTF